MGPITPPPLPLKLTLPASASHMLLLSCWKMCEPSSVLLLLLLSDIWPFVEGQSIMLVCRGKVLIDAYTQDHLHSCISADDPVAKAALMPCMHLQGILSSASDVYALGVLLWEMCSQQRAFSGLSLPSILSHTRLRKALPRLPSELPSSLQVSAPCQTPLHVWFCKLRTVPGE